jgi:hypothetical protein
VGDVDLPDAAQDARAGDHEAALAHFPAVDEGRGVAGDENEDLGRVAEAVVANGDPGDEIGRDVIEKDQPQREATEQIEPQIAFGGNHRGLDGCRSFLHAAHCSGPRRDLGVTSSRRMQAPADTPYQSHREREADFASECRGLYIGNR